MSRRAFTLAMVYANWTEPNIRCELFLRTLQPRSFRLADMDLLRDSLWFLIGLAVVMAFWFAVGYALISWL